MPELPSVRRRRRLQTLPKVVDYRYKNSNPYGVVAVTQVKVRPLSQSYQTATLFSF